MIYIFIFLIILLYYNYISFIFLLANTESSILLLCFIVLCMYALSKSKNIKINNNENIKFNELMIFYTSLKLWYICNARSNLIKQYLLLDMVVNIIEYYDEMLHRISNNIKIESTNTVNKAALNRINILRSINNSKNIENTSDVINITNESDE